MTIALVCGFVVCIQQSKLSRVKAKYITITKMEVSIFFDFRIRNPAILRFDHMDYKIVIQLFVLGLGFRTGFLGYLARTWQC